MFESITESLYVKTSRSFDSNISYLSAGNHHILVDTGTGLFTEEVDDDLKKLGVSLNEITDVVLTHSHIDHIGGLVPILELTSPKIYLHRAEAEKINAGDMSSTLADTFGVDLPSMKIEGILEEGQILQFDGITMKVLHTPGHSSGSICLELENTGVMITGDTLFAGGSFGRVDFPGSSAKQIVESLKRLSTLDFQIAIPGHNQIIRHGANLSAERSYQIAKNWFNL